MRLPGGVAVLVAASMSTSAIAQTATEAFECALPYRAAMEAVAALTVSNQREDNGLGGLLGKGAIVEFAPGSTLIHGQVPVSLTFTLREPGMLADENIYTALFEASFAHDHVIDDALIASNDWRYCGKDLALCQRTNDPEGGPTLRYYRDRVWDDGEDESLRLVCEYKLREEDFPQ